MNTDPRIITAALTGGFAPPERHHPHLPLTPEEIGRQAVECWKAGAAIVHIHARDDRGRSSWEREYFDRSLAVIRDAGSDVIVNLTTSWGGTSPETADEQRFAPLECGSELASFDCGSMNFNGRVFHNTPRFLRALAERMTERGVKPEIEIFDAGMIETAKKLHAEGVLEGPMFFQLVLGIDGGAPATPEALTHLLRSLPEDSRWSVCAVGRSQLQMNALALVLGGHARTGLEDNFWLRKGVSASNVSLVDRLVRLAETLEVPVATPDQAREILGLARTPA